MSALIGSVLVVLGSALLAVACFGVLRLPDALSRQHAATKAATLALGVMSVGMAVLYPEVEMWLRLLLLFATLTVTMPLASHALARAAHRRAGTAQEDDGDPES